MVELELRTGRKGGRCFCSVDNPYSSPDLCAFVLGLCGHFVLIAWVLTEFTNSDVPWSDSFTTALSIVGMWMLARKYVEQWLVWIVVDVVCCGLYVYKELYFTAGLYGLYALIAIGGYKKWIRMMEEEK